MKRNTLTTAVLAGLTGMAGMVSVSNAVNVNPDGLGQVLLYPYYSARGGNDTLISIVNTTERGKAVKIRFIEALNSREVLDFNIYMSAFDVWATAITDDPDTDGARIVFSDNTCTAPYLLETQDGSQPFLAAGYAGDGGPQGLDRTKSGYIEVIEMGELAEGSDAEFFADHDNGAVAGVPPVSGPTGTTCGFFTAAWIGSQFANGTGLWLGDSEAQIDPPAGGLFGSGALINVAEGTMFTYNATAIDGFWDAGEINHTDPESLLPTLAFAADESFVFVNGQLSNEQWDDGLNAVNHVLTFETLMNEYAIEADVGGASEWVVTFPTKRFHTDAAPGGPRSATGTPRAPFTSVWEAPPTGTPWACEELDLAVWDREEQVPDPARGGIGVSPPTTTEEEVFELCREANVIRFSNDGSLPDVSEIFKDPSSDAASAPEYGYVNFDLPSDFQHGWARFDFSDFRSEASQGGNQAVGLPVIGFWANTYTSGAVVADALSNYGGSYNHRGSRVFPVSAE